MMSGTPTYKTRSVRFWLFGFWFVSIVVYPIVFFVLGAATNLLEGDDATDLAKLTLIHLLPVLVAFVSFFFSVDDSQPIDSKDDTKNQVNNRGKSQFRSYMKREEVIVLFAVTFLVHLIAGSYLAINFFYFTGEPDSQGNFPLFKDIGRNFIDFLVLLSPISFVPTEFLTRRQIHMSTD